MPYTRIYRAISENILVCQNCGSHMTRKDYLDDSETLVTIEFECGRIVEFDTTREQGCQKNTKRQCVHEELKAGVTSERVLLHLAKHNYVSAVKLAHRLFGTSYSQSEYLIMELLDNAGIDFQYTLIPKEIIDAYLLNKYQVRDKDL